MKLIRVFPVIAAVAVSAAFAAPQVPSYPQDNTARDRSQAGESAQPVSDTWITTKVKTELLAADKVKGTSIEVETSNGVVTLSGNVATEAEKSKAVDVARQIKGVTDVDATALMVGAP